MKVCKKYQDLFWMDVHGELHGEQRYDWDLHLRNCDDCRQEKSRALEMLRGVKTVMSPVPPTTETLQAVSARIIDIANKRDKPTPKPSQRLFRPALFIPALTAVCLLLITAGIFLKTNGLGPNEQMTASVQSVHEQIPAADIEIIQHIELLTEFDSIEKLVQTVDHSEKPEKLETNHENMTKKGVPGGSMPVYGKIV